jgi:H+/Cl- antiporter ClcA
MGITMTSEPEAGLKTSFYLLMVYAALIGAISSLLTAGYITLYNQGIKFFEQVSLFVFNVNIWPLVLLTGAGVLIGLLIKFFGQRGGLGVAQREYAQTGRLNPRNLPSILLQAFISLWSGAAVGPEGPLVFLSGGVGSFISDRLRLQKDDVQVLVYSSIAGAFGGFFGSPIVGAVGAIEYMFIRELDLYRHLIPGLLAAAIGYGVYATFLQTSFLGIYNFPDYAPPRLVDLWWALLVGVIAGGVGIVYKLIFGIVQLVFTPLEKRPVRRAIIGGVVIGLIGSFLPLTLYSGQDQLLQIIHNPAAFGIGLLLLMMLIKALLTSTSFATGFEGGPIFPLTFVGGTLGLAISKILTFIPEGVAVTAGMAGVACAVFPLPLTMALLLGLLGGQPDLLPPIVIGAVIGFLVSKAITPLLPKRKPKSGEGSKQSQRT